MNYGFRIAAALTTSSVVMSPGAVLAQSDCSNEHGPAEIVEVLAVRSWLLELYLWPSNHTFNAAVRTQSNDNAEKGANCLTAEQSAGAPVYSTVRFKHPGIDGSSTFKVRVFWADRDEGTTLGKAGDIFAARCSSADLQGQTEECDPWRKIGIGYRLIVRWPMDWR
jgi:hypothetical protein